MLCLGCQSDRNTDTKSYALSNGIELQTVSEWMRNGYKFARVRLKSESIEAIGILKDGEMQGTYVVLDSVGLDSGGRVFMKNGNPVGTLDASREGVEADGLLFDFAFSNPDSVYAAGSSNIVTVFPVEGQGFTLSFTITQVDSVGGATVRQVVSDTVVSDTSSFRYWWGPPSVNTLTIRQEIRPAGSDSIIHAVNYRIPVRVHR